jgi:hypothetical protein
VGRRATRGSKPGGTTGAGWQATVVVEPARGSRVPMVKTVEPDSKRKSRSVRLNEATSGKLSSSKNHMSRDDQAVCQEIKATTAFVIGRVAQEDTSGGSRGELMGRGGGDVWITCTTEDTEVLVRGCEAKENDMRVGSTNRLRGEMVQ